MKWNSDVARKFNLRFPVLCVALLALLGLFAVPSRLQAGMPYGAQSYGTGWYGFGSAELILDKTMLVIPEGTTTQLVLHLSTQPPRSQTVTVSRVSGDVNVGFSGATNFVFSTNNWNQNQALTITTAVNVARVDGTAIVQCASLELTSTNVTVLRSGRLGMSDADADGSANLFEYIAGSDWLSTQSVGLTTALDRTTTNAVIGFDRVLAIGPDYSNQTRHYRVDSRTNLVAGQWAPVPGATNITGTGAYSYGLSTVGTSQFYRVRVWLTTP